MQTPSVGRVVHYRSYGTPGGKYKPECRAAVITEVTGDTVGLCVLNPTGQFFDRAVAHDDGAGNPGDPACPSIGYHDTHRYCPSCSFTAPDGPAGGTWHWPERVDD